jgi:hypothetical protein
MQMTPEQLLEEYRDTVMELHLTRRQLNHALAETERLRAEVKQLNGEAAQPVHHHHHGDDGHDHGGHGHEHSAAPKAA